jgi:hypothetical protein
MRISLGRIVDYLPEVYLTDEKVIKDGRYRLVGKTAHLSREDVPSEAAIFFVEKKGVYVPIEPFKFLAPWGVWADELSL